MDKITVVVISKPDVPHLSVLKELPDSAHVVLGNSVAELASAMPGADVILNSNFGRDPFAGLFPAATSVKWVHCLSAGVESMLTPELIASPVPLTNGRGVFRTSLSEWCLGAMLFFSKQTRRLIEQQERGEWGQFDIELLEGKTLGVVGYGEIGRATAQLAHAFGMKVIAVRRRTSLSQADPLLDATYAPDQLHQMLAECDFVVVATPNTPETKGMIGAAELARMKKTAVILNVGRGPVIVESALVSVLASGQIRGAALDVFEHEPLPPGHPFFALKNVLLSPHSADHTDDWIHRAMHKFVDNFKLYASGAPLQNIVDKKAGY